MTAGTVLAVDAGTTGVTALVVTHDGRVAARGYREFPQHFPADGWVEHEPDEIWAATLTAVREALDRAEAAGVAAPSCVGITNQRETVVLWDRETLGAARRAIVWQDRRTADLCDQLRAAGHEPRVSELTGLRLDPYFSATKLTWLAANDAAHVGGRRRRAGGRRHGRLVPRRPDDPQASSTSPTRRTPPGPCSSTSAPAGGRPSSASCSASRWRRSPRSCPRTGSSAGPTRPSSPGWTCRSPGSPATSRRRCSGRPASRRARRSARTAPARSSW